MFVHRLKKRLIELGDEQFVRNLEGEYKEKQQMNKKKKQRNKVLSSNFQRVAFKLAYVGINYHGLESQINHPNTIESHLFKGLLRVKMIDERDTCNYNRAGRTDKGVSALGNVIALNVRKIGKDDLLFGEMINRVLPDDIQILDECNVDETFNARYDCIKRVYKYYFYKMYYNLELIEQAMHLFEGEHDFRNFCKMDVIANQSFVRDIKKVSLEEVFPDGAPRDTTLFKDDDRLRLFCITIEGNAFLWHQIRYMMAILFIIGKGEEQLELIPRLLTKFDGKPNYQMAAEYPLVLYECHFKQQLFNPKQESHIKLIQGVYENLRENLSKKYIEFLHFQQMGMSLLKVPIQGEKIIEKNKKSLLKQKSGVTLQGAIDNLKGKRKEKYELKIKKVKEYQERVQ